MLSRTLPILFFASAMTLFAQVATNPVASDHPGLRPPLLRKEGSKISDLPPVEPGVSRELARWRAARYSDVRYKLNLTLEKMSPVLKGTMEVRVRVSGGDGEKGSGGAKAETRPVGSVPPIVLDWRKIKGFEDRSEITSVSVNGREGYIPPAQPIEHFRVNYVQVDERDDHLIFTDGVVVGENVIKLDFTSPILTSGSAITRYVDKEDGSEYIYSLFVPSDASTAFPVFDQPDLKAKWELFAFPPKEWTIVSNTGPPRNYFPECKFGMVCPSGWMFEETKPISTYVFAFAAGPFEKFGCRGGSCGRPAFETSKSGQAQDLPLQSKSGQAQDLPLRSDVYVRKSQAEKFKPHAAEVFRLNREAIKYFEQYFDYKFPFPKYDLVLIPEFPFGGMEHAGATYLRESAIIFPQEPTKNDHISRAVLIFHEAAHQWFGDTVTMRWFDDLWLKEGFANFAAYKAMERIMPEANAWKIFYERIKQGAYQTDSTKGTTPIYQEIKNLSAAKSAYGAIVYNKAPAFLRQAEFYLGEDKFQTGVRAFLKKHEYANAGWEDLVMEFEGASGQKLQDWASRWVTKRGMYVFAASDLGPVKNTIKLTRQQKKSLGIDPDKQSETEYAVTVLPRNILGENATWGLKHKTLFRFADQSSEEPVWEIGRMGNGSIIYARESKRPVFAFANYGDYGYGIFLLDEKSRDYVLKNIQNERDPFLRTMMWGALWDSVREGELDPRVFVELVVRVLGSSPGVTTPSAETAATPPKTGGEPRLQKPDREGGRNAQRPDQALANAQASASEDESTVALLLNRVGTAMNYYLSEPPASAGGQKHGVNSTNWPAANAAGSDLRTRVENMLIERMQNAASLGQRITYYRAFLNIASSEKARDVLKRLLAQKAEPLALASGKNAAETGLGKTDGAKVGALPPAYAGGSAFPIRTKDRFDIVTRLLILGDVDAPKLLADLEKAETSDDAKRYAYAARAGIGTAENKAKYWNDFVNNKEISESWIEAAFGPWNSIRHSELTLPYLQKALQELPNHKRNRKIFFVNGWLGAFIGGQRSEEALAIVNKFLADNPNLDKDLRLKILENADIIERAVKIRSKFKN